MSSSEGLDLGSIGQSNGADAVRLATSVLSGANRELFQRYEVEAGKAKQLAMKVQQQEDTIRHLTLKLQDVADKQLEEANALYGDIQLKKNDIDAMDREEADIEAQVMELLQAMQHLTGSVTSTRQQLSYNFELGGAKGQNTGDTISSPTRVGERFLAIDADEVFKSVSPTKEIADLLGVDSEGRSCGKAMKPQLILLGLEHKKLQDEKAKVDEDYDRGALFQFEVDEQIYHIERRQQHLKQRFVDMLAHSSERGDLGDGDDDDEETHVSLGVTRRSGSSRRDGVGPTPAPPPKSAPAGRRPPSGKPSLDRVMAMVDENRIQIAAQTERLRMQYDAAKLEDDRDFEEIRRSKEDEENQEPPRWDDGSKLLPKLSTAVAAFQSSGQQRSTAGSTAGVSHAESTSSRYVSSSRPLMNSDALYRPASAKKARYQLAASRAIGYSSVSLLIRDSPQVSYLSVDGTDAHAIALPSRPSAHRPEMHYRFRTHKGLEKAVQSNLEKKKVESTHR